MDEITLIEAINWVAQFCLAFSILNALLPPYDVLEDFPAAQRYYKLVLALVGFFAGDVRAKVMALYPSFNRSIKGVAIKEQKVEDLKQDVAALKEELVKVEESTPTTEKKDA